MYSSYLNKSYQIYRITIIIRQDNIEKSYWYLISIIGNTQEDEMN